MLSPNLAFDLFPKQSFSVDGQVFRPNFVQSADLSALSHAAITKLKIYLFALPDPILSENIRPGSELHFFYLTQHQLL